MRISNIKTAIRKAENDQETLKNLQAMLEEKQAKLLRELTQIEELLAFAHEKQESLGMKLREQERAAYRDSRQYDRQGFIRYLREAERTKNTITAYVKCLDLFFEHETEFTQDAVFHFKDYLMDTVSVGTVNLRLCGLRAYAEYLDIPLKIRPVKVQKTSYVKNVISQADYERLLKNLQRDGNTKWYLGIKFLACTGARVSEFRQFKKKHLYKGEMELLTKGKVRTIYIPSGLAEESREFFADLKDNDYLFGGKGEGGIMSSRGVSEQLRRFADKYDIPREVMHPHSFRHRFAINFLQENKDIALLADLMGHSGVNTTMIYLRLSKEEQRRAIDDSVRW